MANVLIATLGDHPTVVTAMVKALHEVAGINLEIVHVIYPGAEGERYIEWGYEQIEEHLRGRYQCDVRPCALDFSDANSYDRSIEFLRVLAGLLDGYEAVGDTVYLSLAGGRKNMSAMMALVTQFYPCVKGLYHLIDRYEDHRMRRSFLRAEELLYDSDPESKFFPETNRLALVEIPFACFSNAVELRRYFASVDRDENFVLLTHGAADAFFSTVFQPKSTSPLKVYLSRPAFDEYQELGPQIQRNFDHCFERMSNAQLLESPKHKHSKFKGRFRTDCYCFKMGRTQARPFYYRDDDEVVVCRLTLHGSSYERLISDGELWRSDHPKFKSLLELHAGEAVLLVPLGESPMIVTQTYVLLQKLEKLTAVSVVVLYPEGHAPNRSAANLLNELFRRRKIPFEKRPIKGLRDVDSHDACQIYSQHIMSTIEDLRVKHPGRQVAISLSGGRKGMSALSLFAAQRADIERVYHTLITDPVLEDQVERECSLEGLRKCSPAQQAERLFLEAYKREAFTLFPIPVVPIQ